MVEVRKFVDWEGRDDRGDRITFVVVSLDLGWRRLAVAIAVNRGTGETTVRVGASLQAAVDVMDKWLGQVSP